MSKITESARDKNCLVRLPCCNRNQSTTVHAHYRSVSLGAGVALKPHDLLGARACSDCHNEIDRRTRLYEHHEARLAHAEGCLRTIKALIDEGVIRV
jgi:hypothetical protein